jgi:hypothetical protein
MHCDYIDGFVVAEDVLVRHAKKSTRAKVERKKHAAKGGALFVLGFLSE